MTDDVVLNEKSIYELPINIIDLSESDLPEPEFLIKDFIVKKSICLLGAQRSSFKSWIGLYITVCLSEGLAFLEKYESRKCNVLYFDAEMGYNLLKKNLNMILNGMNVKLTNPNTVFDSFRNKKIDDTDDLSYIEDLIKTHKSDVLVLDSFRRFHNARENIADEISPLFINFIRPLIEKNDLTVILIHHTRKKPVGVDVYDKMDSLRGSSEIPNLSDSILMIERQGKEPFILLSNEKSRFGQEVETIGIKLEFDNNSSEVKFSLIPESEWSISQAPYYEKLALEWFRKDTIGTFKTKDLIQHFINNKINCQDMTIKRVLDALLDKNIIRKIKKGVYEVIEENQTTLG